MAKSVLSDVLDAALAEVATATRLVLCSAEPANFAGIAAVALADVTVTAGDGGGDFTIADGDASGRKVTVAQQAGFTIDASGTASHIVLDDGTDLQYVTTCTSQALTSGGTVTVAAWDIEIAGTLVSGSLPAGLIFASEWDDLGDTDADITDANRATAWDIAFGTSNLHEVRDVSVDGLGFPTDNYLRTSVDSGGSGLQLDTIQWAAPAVGEKVTARFYRSQTTPDSYAANDGTHPDYFVTNSATPGWGPGTFGLEVHTNSSGKWEISVSTGDLDSVSFRIFNLGFVLDKDTIYRIELKYERTGTSTYTLDVRIYSLAETLLYDGSDFTESGSGDQLDAETFTLSSDAGAGAMRMMRIGPEGLSPSPASEITYADYAAVAVCKGSSAAWPVGPYRGAIEKAWTP